MASQVKGALDKIRAAQHGQRRSDQYMVAEEKRIVDEVSDEEYRNIVKERRTDWVVGSEDFGYGDEGKEIWEDGEALSEVHQRTENRKAKLETSMPKDPEVSGGEQTTFGTFQAGARADVVGGNVAANSGNLSIQEQHRQQELDDMLQKMCGSLEKEVGTSDLIVGVKRKQDRVDGGLSERGAGDSKRLGITSNQTETQLPPQSVEPDIKMESVEKKEIASLSGGIACQPLVEDDGGLWFYFMDAFEDDRASPPRVFLFGKIRAVNNESKSIVHQSCCFVVEDLERCVHLLLNVPDDEVAQDVAQSAEDEFKRVCAHRCPKVRFLKSQLKWRNYAFEKNLPQGHGHLPFLKVLIDASEKLPLGLSGEFFSHVFGAQSSCLERLLLSRRVVGPSWLRLQPGTFREQAVKFSSCAYELSIKTSSITALKTPEEHANALGRPSSSPPLRVLTLNMQTMQPGVQHGHEPVVAAMNLYPSCNIDGSESDMRVGMEKWLGVRRFDSQPLPRDSEKLLPQRGIQHFSSEAAMLTALLTKIGEFDPDVIVGHNLYGFDLDVLAARMQAQNIQSWQKLGRLRRARQSMPRIDGRQGAGFWIGSNLTIGRLLCDVHLQAKDLLPKLLSYDLKTIAQEQLQVGIVGEAEPEALRRQYDQTSSLVSLVEATSQNASCLAQLMHSLQILPLSKQLTCLAGNLWNGSLQNRRAERNEMLLCHEFHKKKFIIPDRENAITRAKRKTMANGRSVLDNPDEHETSNVSVPRRGKAAFAGGLVLEPKVGLYDDFVMMLDFNSLYPSIIQEHNICFTTVDRPDELEAATLTTEADLLSRTQLPDGTVAEGILPQVLRRLVESRREVKGAIKSEKDARRLQMLDIRQKALKLTANSMYGCLGFQNGRFYAKSLAALVTCKGREALQSTCTIVAQELQLDVVYGDTDSVFVNSKTKDFEQAMQVAQQIKRSVNKRYKRLEIEVDGIFKRLLLLKKKKYAGLKVIDWAGQKFESELKGLDIVRRDWCGLAKGLGDVILQQILRGDSKEEPAHWIASRLMAKAADMDGNKVPVDQFVITKTLTKAPHDYPDAKHQAHVQVALRLMARGKAVRPGQDIAYIICEATGTQEKTSFADRARHPEELQLDPNLQIDISWYKSQQVHPLVTRILIPIEGIDAARIAECLGMDGKRFMKTTIGHAEHSLGSFVEATSANVAALLDRNARWKKFESCLEGVALPGGEVATWRHLLKPETWDVEGAGALFRTPSGGGVSPRKAQNLFVLQLRKLLLEYSEGWVMTGDAGDHQDVGLFKTRRMRSGQNCVSEQDVLQQLEFMEYLTDMARKGQSGEDDDRGCRAAADTMHRVCKFLLESNGYYWVDCSKVFASMGSS